MGAFYEDDFEYLRSQLDPKYDTNDRNIVTPKKMEVDKALQDVELDPIVGFGMEVSSPEVDWSKMNKPTGGVAMPDVGMSPFDKAVEDFKKQASKPVSKKLGDMSSKEAQQAMDLAMSFSGAGIIAGVKSSVPSLMKATKESGWFKGSDGKMRYEISDEGMKFTKELNPGDSGKLKEFIDHPELYKAYPEIGDINFKVGDDSGRGYLAYYNDVTKTLMVDPKRFNSTESALDAAVHELQHVVQSKEGFALGSNPTVALDKAKDALASKIRGMEYGPDKQALYDLYFEIKANANKFAEYMYLRTPGEVEANSVAARRKLSDKQRKEFPVKEMEKMLEGETNTLHGGKYLPEFNYP